MFQHDFVIPLQSCPNLLLLWASTFGDEQNVVCFYFSISGCLVCMVKVFCFKNVVLKMQGKLFYDNLAEKFLNFV